MTGVTIDWDLIERRITSAARDGLISALRYAEERAKYHAPVRAIFDRGRRGFSAGTGKTPSTEFPRGEAVNFNRVRYRNPHSGRFAGGPMVAVRRTRARESIIRSPEVTRRMTREETTRRAELGLVGSGGDTFRGHANSHFPILRTGDIAEANQLVRGDLRRAGTQVISQRVRPPHIAQVENILRSRSPDDHGVMRDGVPVMRRFADGSIATDSVIHPNDYLTGRGRYEVRSGRALHRDVAKGGFDVVGGKLVRNVTEPGVQRVGGRLRDSIDIIPPSLEVGGAALWGYVVSPVRYSKPQEFGASSARHSNRAHPFMRPALYESRKELASRVRRELSGLRLGSLEVIPS
jgi:hypothetical protein